MTNPQIPDVDAPPPKHIIETGIDARNFLEEAQRAAREAERVSTKRKRNDKET